MMQFFDPGDLQQALVLTERGRDVPQELISRLASQALDANIDQTQEEMEDNVGALMELHAETLEFGGIPNYLLPREGTA